MANHQDRSSIVASLFHFLDEGGVEYCALGSICAHLRPGDDAGRLGLPIPIVLPAATLEKLPGLLQKFCTQQHLLLVEYLHEEPTRHRCMLSWTGRDGRPAFVFIDARSDFVRAGTVIFAAKDLLKDRVPVAVGSIQRLGGFAAAPAKEFICTLLDSLDHDELTEDTARHLREQWARDPQGAAALVQRWWDPQREGGIIVRCAEGGSWDPLRNAMTQLRNALPRATLSAWWQRNTRDLRRWREPAGLLVACLGPDGSGKASVMDALSRDPLAPFAQADTMHLRPGLLRRSGTRLKPRSVVEKPRGLAATLLKLVMFAVDYWLGYWVCVRPKLVRATLLISHRYYDDVLVDPIRYRMAGSRRLARLLLPLIPRPELWLVFDLPAESLHARQQNVDEEEADRQRGAYRRALRRHESFVVLDARQPLPQVIAESEKAIVNQLAQRTAERLRLPRNPVRNRTSANVLLFFCRHQVPMLSKLVRIVFNSDICCLIPDDIQLPHPFGLVIHSQAVIGRRVTILQQVTIGGKDPGESVAPVIGNDVYVGAGARILGDVRIGDGAIIGANAVVTRDIPAGATVVGTNRIVTPARYPGRPVMEQPADVVDLSSRIAG